MDGIVSWPHGAAGQAEPETLSHFLETVAAMRPDAVALRQDDQAITWSEFLSRSRRLAGGLAARGLRRGDTLAVWLPAHPDFLVLCFAAWRLGVAVLSLNPRFRHAELDQVLASRKPAAIAFGGAGGSDGPAEILGQVSPDVLSDLRLLILQSDDPARPFVAPASLAAVDLAPLATLEAGPEFTGDLADPDSPAIAFTTSGTTSRPKLALHRHAGIARHARDVAPAFGFDAPGALLLEIMPLCGAYGFNQSMGAIAAGCPQILMPQFEAPKAVALLRGHGATHLLTTNDMLHAMLRAAPEERPFPSLRLCICGVFGPNPPGVMEEAAARGLPLHGCYGSSELQALCLSQRLDVPPHLRQRPGGFPVSSTGGMRVRDEATGALAAPGELGMLEVRCQSLMMGYAGDAEATRATLTEDGWFRTSDLGTIEADGAFVLIGRSGEALRLGGVLIHPSEIESYIERHPAIRAAQVVGAQTGDALCTVAFVRLNDGAALDEAALRAWCTRGMAWFKVPDRIIAVDDFPVTRSGNGNKIQRSELRVMAQRLLDEHARDAALRLAEAEPARIAATEARIAAIWAEELEILRVDLAADFRDLGGDSLAAIRIVHAVEAAFGCALPASAVGAMKTARDMARLVLASETAAPQAGDGARGEGLDTSERRVLSSVMAIGAIPVAYPGSPMKLLNAAGTRAPIFWCFNNPAQEMAELGAALGRDRPLYGLYSGGFLFDSSDATIGRMARYYADEILALDPTGPCVIGGNCRGGWLASRIARLLVAAGKPVEALCLVEYADPSLAAWEGRLMMLFARHSRLRAYRAISWQRPGWDAGFRSRPVTAWIDGAHGQVFARRHAAGLASRITAFLDGVEAVPTPEMQRRDARTLRIHRTPGAFALSCLAERVRRLRGEGHSERVNPFTGEKRRYTPSVLFWVARRRLRRALGRH